MTKKEAKTRKEAWTTALAEHRVLRFNDGERLVSYPTIEARDGAYFAAVFAGLVCEVVS